MKSKTFVARAIIVSTFIFLAGTPSAHAQVDSLTGLLQPLLPNQFQLSYLDAQKTILSYYNATTSFVADTAAACMSPKGEAITAAAKDVDTEVSGDKKTEVITTTKRKQVATKKINNVVAVKNTQIEKNVVGTTDAPADVRKVMYVSATAYSSTPDQTDSTPCITANGFNVCKNGAENVLAANFLPFGTNVRIPDIYGERVFTVHDRMAPRYQNRVDVWMTSREAAMQFGVKKIKIEVLED